MTVRPTNEQIEFARRMTQRQRDTLRVLAMFPFHMSASERGDPELYALVRNKLVECYSNLPNAQALYMWEATPQGKAISQQLCEGTL
jgi:hypothetical protein